MKFLNYLSVALLSACSLQAPQVDTPIHNPAAVVIVLPSVSNSPLNKLRLIKTTQGECLDIHGNDGKTLIRHHCHGKNNQQFVFFDDLSIRQNNKCLDVAGEDHQAGTRVILHTCHGKKNQQWYQDGSQIRSVMHGLCLDAKNSIISLQVCNRSPSQQFAL